MFSGEDTSGGIVDPQASIATDATGVELCLFVDCLSGIPDPQCMSGEPAADGTRVGCCSLSGDAQLEGGTSGLCINATDSANVYVRVRGQELGEGACQQYSLVMYY